jgi:hypothetical protein
MPRFGAPPRSTRSRRLCNRSGDSPLDMIDELGTGFISTLLDLGRYAAESTTEHALYYAGRQARRLGRAIKRRFRDR